MNYDRWKSRSPDDDLGDPSMYERPDPDQERADWEDQMQQHLMVPDPPTCIFCNFEIAACICE